MYQVFCPLEHRESSLNVSLWLTSLFDETHDHEPHQNQNNCFNIIRSESTRVRLDFVTIFNF